MNVADGTADTDAATVGQLNSGVTDLGSKVADIIGGNGFTYDGEAFSGYAVEIGGEGYYTVEAALNALYNGTAGSTIGAVVGDEIVIDPTKGAITIAEGGNIKITQDGVDTDKFTVSVSPTPTFTSVYADSASIGGITIGSGGISLGGKQITGLAEGNIAMGSTDAVTGGQLYSLSESAVKYDDATKNKITLAGTNGLTHIANVADGVAETDAVNVRQLNSGVKAGLASLGSGVAGIIGTTIGYDGENFSGAINIGGSDYTTIEAALNALYNGTAGSTGGAVGGDEIVIDPDNGAITIAEGGNIQITQDDADTSKFTVSVSPTPTFTSVYADSASIGGITIGSGGINLGGNKKITGLADGYADTDAVNVRQLKSLGVSIKDTIGSEVARVVGGGLSYSGDTFSGGLTVGSSTYTTVQEALNALYNNTAGGSGTQNPGGGTIVIDPSEPQKITIGEGKNINIAENDVAVGVYTIGISESPQFTSVSADNATIGGMTMNSGGITMGGKQITGLAEGNIAMESTDAVTGGQLYDVKAEIWDSITEIDKRVTKTEEAIEATPGGIKNGVQYDDDSKTTITLNKGGEATQITNLADGAITATSTDAVTGRQLYEVNEDITNIDDRVTNTEKNVTKIIDGIATGDIDIITGNSTAVKYDDNSNTLLTMNKGGEATQITNVADGDITATSTDAVTGGQLYSLGESVKDALGGTSNFENGKVTAGIEVGGTTYTSVQDALNAVNTGFENGVQYDDSSRGTLTLNKGGEATQVTNVADGRIAAGSRDAVTGNQLYQAYQRMNDLDKSIDVVGAHAAAMSALHPVPYNKYEPTTFSAGVGTYHDECAMAIGAFHYIRPNLMVNVGASVCSDGDVMGRIGLSIALGKSTKKQPELAHDVAGMQEQMYVMQAKLIALEEQNRRDKEIIQKNAEIMAQNEKLIRELMQKSENK